METQLFCQIVLAMSNIVGEVQYIVNEYKEETWISSCFIAFHYMQVYHFAQIFYRRSFYVLGYSHKEVRPNKQRTNVITKWEIKHCTLY